jgi:glycosyltransferase involved in cell wall biosynthesis
VHHTFLPTAYLVVTPVARAASGAVLVQARRSLRDHIRGFTRPAGGLGAQVRYLGVRSFDRLSVRLTEHFVANSDAVARNALDHEAIRPAAMSVIPNGIRPEFFAVPPLAAGPSAPAGDAPCTNIACVANFHAYKGHAELMAVAQRLADEGAAITLTFVGDGEQRAELERRAAQHHLPVRFLGQRTDVDAVLREVDILVHPSRSEGLSNSILEAMAAGRPVVATDAGGTREAVGDAGLIVPVGDADALEAALRRLIDDPDERVRVGAQARRRARDLFSVDVMVDRYVDLYGRLAHERSNRWTNERADTCAG